MQVLQTKRLNLSYLTFDDTEFIIGLLNDPSFVRYIGDKGVRTTEDAHEYFQTGPLQSYEAHGYGLFRTALRDGGAPIGMCGLLQRDYLDDPDIGFALLPEYCSKGYAFEAAQGVLEWGRDSLGIRRIVGLVDARNRRSVSLLEKLGLEFDKSFRVDGDDRETSLYAINF